MLRSKHFTMILSFEEAHLLHVNRIGNFCVDILTMAEASLWIRIHILHPLLLFGASCWRILGAFHS